MNEEGAEPTDQNTPTEDVIQADPSKGEKVKEKLTEETSEVMAVRQCERIKKQGPEGIKIAEKAEIAIKKKNLEGNNIKLKNSFAVLDNSSLFNKFSRMGGNIADLNLEILHIIKEHELARNNLKEKGGKVIKETDLENEENLPLEEIRLIEWKPDFSEPSDNEGFVRVSRK
jgi:hypothetical protein